MTTLPPSATRALACAAPIPRAPPLISATFPSTRPMTRHATAACCGLELVPRHRGVGEQGNNHTMDSLLTACSGFLLAVLWMDLMFDQQVLTGQAYGAENCLSQCWTRSRATTGARSPNRDR